MKYQKIILLFSSLLFSFNLLAAGNSNGGKVAHIASVNDVLLFSIIGNSESNRPACSTTKRFSVRKDSIHVSVIISAFETGRELKNVRGFGSCNLWGNSEDLRWIEVCPISGCL